MKKLQTLMLAGAMFTTATFAQPKTAAAPVKPQVKTEMKKAAVIAAAAPATKQDAKVAPAKKMEAAKPAAPAKAESPKMKKDGTPDMRMKENKIAAPAKPAAGPAKKDGTPDMRFKENKKPEAAKPAIKS